MERWAEGGRKEKVNEKELRKGRKKRTEKGGDKGECDEDRNKENIDGYSGKRGGK